MPTAATRPQPWGAGAATVSAMAPRRDARRFGPGPYLLGLRWERARRRGFPYDVPAVAAIEDLRLDAPVTMLAGDNGTGKSTLVEAIAAAIGFADEGGELERSGELPAVPRPVLDGALAPVLTSSKPRNGYFLRAESFFNVARFVDGEGIFAPDLSLYGDVPLHRQSHGESFLALAANRFGADGLYILDEPEAALSVTGALALLSTVVRAARGGAQFVIATHSPVLLACPDARIFELDDTGIAPCAYDDLEAVRLTRGFLDSPERYLRAAIEGSDGD
jgi:predicted ATPase